MKIGFLITARLKSSRLKLKLLKQLNGQTVISHVINRAKEVVECDDIVLCTSEYNQDLPLVRIAQRENIYYFNGDGDDVLTRLKSASELFGFDFVICITADNPLFSIYHANLLSDYIRSDQSIDFITTVGMPIGVNIYGIKTKALQTVCAVKEEIDTEIWGPLIHKDIFKIKEIEVEEHFKYPKIQRLTLDEIDDYHLFRNIYNNIPVNVIDILDVYDFLEENPLISALNEKVIQKSLDIEVLNRINQYFEVNKVNILKLKEKIYNE